ncbi:MAG: sugar phosphate isomerase/epimerase family protein [Phycisphaerae bacterium]
MPTAARDFGVQSYCFRSFKDNAAVARMVREIGVDKVEVCAVHASFDDPAAFKDVVKTYADEGVSVVSIGVETFTGDEKHARNRFECIKAAGASHLSAHFKVDSFQKAVPQMAKLAQEYDARVAIHCHGGYMFGGQPDVIAHLLEIGGPRIGVCIDSAWAMQIGPRQGNPVQWAQKFAGRVYGLHYKDFTFDRDGKWNDVVVGTGNLDLPAYIRALETNGFDGYAVLEYEADPENPVPALKACVERMRQLEA